MDESQGSECGASASGIELSFIVYFSGLQPVPVVLFVGREKCLHGSLGVSSSRL